MKLPHLVIAQNASYACDALNRARRRSGAQRNYCGYVYCPYSILLNEYRDKGEILRLRAE
jgi:hypothetical protein